MLTFEICCSELVIAIVPEQKRVFFVVCTLHFGVNSVNNVSEFAMNSDVAGFGGWIFIVFICRIQRTNGHLKGASLLTLLKGTILEELNIRTRKNGFRGSSKKVYTLDSKTI